MVRRYGLSGFGFLPGFWGGRREPQLFCLAAVLTMSVAAAQGPAQQQGAEELFARGVQLQQSGDLEGAVRAYLAFLEVYPETLAARSNLGAAYARLGRYAEAIDQYKKALALDRTNTAIRFNLALAYYKAIQIPQAAEEFAAVVIAQPDNKNAAVLLADCHLRLGENKKAIELLSPLDAAFGDDRAYLYVLGTALIRDKQTDKGQLLIDRILRQGDSAEARMMLGTARLIGRDFPGALKEFERAVQLNPKLPSASSFYGRALMATGNREAAMEAFRRELEYNPTDFASHFHMGALLKQDQKFDEALAYLNRALQLQPGATDVRYQIGSLYVSTGDLQEALRMLEPLVKEAPDFVEAHVSLATVYYRLRRKEDGDREREIIRKLNAAIQAKAPGASAELGEAYRGDVLPMTEVATARRESLNPAAEPPSPAPAEKAKPAMSASVAALPAPSTVPAVPPETPKSAGPVSKTSAPAPRTQQATRPLPKTFAAITKRASEAREADQIEEAISLYRQAVLMRPSWAEGWWYLGTLYYGADRYAEGRDAFRRLVALQPKAGPGWALLGLCEFKLREYDRALEHVQRGRELGLGNNDDLKRVNRFHAALLLTRIEEFELALQILYVLAREKGDDPALVEAMGLATLALPYLPSEVPPDKRELVVMAGRANYYTAARRMKEARREYLELVERYPNTPNIHYSYGVFLLLENPDTALEEFRRELQVWPSHISARLQIAFEYIKRDDYKAGLPFAEQAVELAPRLFTARNALGRILLELGETQRAIKELAEGVRLAPDSPETRYSLARAYARAGRKQEAARERAEFARLDKLRRALKEGP